ncbi:MAG: hypothetical protein JST51_01990 [Armatimonadetes bacterium]|nr:hypothetical protein [Armatimonadota bacterium]
MNKQLAIKTIYVVAILTWAGFLYAIKNPLDSGWLKPAGFVLGLITTIVSVFEQSLWKLRFLHPWLVKVPNLNGTYAGTLSSDWTDPQTGNKVGAVDSFISVHQTLSEVTVRLFTEQSASVSVASSLADTKDGIWNLVFVYRNEPVLSIQKESRIHHGGARLTVEGKNQGILIGNYWTDRNTIGELQFEKKSSCLSKSFAEARNNVTG